MTAAAVCLFFRAWMLLGCLAIGAGFGKRACAPYCVPVGGFALGSCVGV